MLTYARMLLAATCCLFGTPILAKVFLEPTPVWNVIRCGTEEAATKIIEKKAESYEAAARELEDQMNAFNDVFRQSCSHVWANWPLHVRTLEVRKIFLKAGASSMYLMWAETSAFKDGDYEGNYLIMKEPLVKKLLGETQ